MLPFEKFLEILAGRRVEWISQGFEPLAGYGGVTAPAAIAGAIARIAIRKAEQGLVQDPAAIEANYVRRSDAELLWKEK